MEGEKINAQTTRAMLENSARDTSPPGGATQKVGIQSWPLEPKRNRRKPRRRLQNNNARMAVQRCDI